MLNNFLINLPNRKMQKSLFVFAIKNDKIKIMSKSDFRHPMNQVSNTAALVPISCSCASSYGRDSGTEGGRGGGRGQACKRGHPPLVMAE